MQHTYTRRVAGRYSLAMHTSKTAHKLPFQGPQFECARRGKWIASLRELRSCYQFQINLGWKLALVEKGLAPQSLLDTYSEERSPVIKQMLQETANMTKAVLCKHSSKACLRAAWQCGTRLKQLGINYRWSRILFDERYKSLSAQHAEAEVFYPYDTGAPSDPVRAGDRAPDATGLVRLDIGQDSDRQTTSLFDMYGPTHHTILIFNVVNQHPIIDLSRSSPVGTIMSIAVFPSSSSKLSTEASLKTDALLSDCDGIAYTEYGVTQGQSLVVIVRPDGYIGAVARGAEGIAKYFGLIFAAPL